MHVTVKFGAKTNTVLLVFNSSVVADLYRVANAPPYNMGIPEKFTVIIDGEAASDTAALHEGTVVEFIAASS